MTIKAGAYDNNPKIYPGEADNWIGFFPTILEYIAEQEDWKIEWVEGTWSECLTRLETGEIDIMVDVAYSDARAELYDFNQVSLFQNWGTVYSAKGNIIDSVYDLEGHNVAVLNNSIHYVGENGIKNLTQKFSVTCTFQELDSYTKVFEAIDNGDSEFGVVNRLFGMVNEPDYEVSPSPIYFNPSDLKFAFPKDTSLSSVLIEKIDRQLIQLKDDPDSIYYEALEKYFLREVDPVSEEIIPQWLIILLSVIGGLGVLLLSTSAILKRVVSKKTEEIREINEELSLFNRIIISTLPDPMVLITEVGEILLMNDLFKNIIEEENGVGIEIGQNILKTTSGDLTQKVKRNIELSKSRWSEDINPSDNHISLKTGKKFEILHGTLELNAKSGAQGIFFLLHDITTFIELENLRKQLISTVSHELRTPITSINLTIANLIKYGDRLDSKKKDNMLAMMSKSGQVLAEMIQDLLIISRIESRKLKINRSVFKPFLLVTNILQQFDGRIQTKKLEIKLRILPSLNTFADPKRIEQTFRIIIDNAIKYSKIDGIVEIDAIENYAGPYNLDNQSGTLFKCIDHGVGVPKNELKQIFTKFYRATNVAEIPGSGLGLCIAKDLIELHNGQVYIESNEGEGTTIIIFVPTSEMI